MNADEEQLSQALAMGREPSIDDLSCALAIIMKERDSYRRLAGDLDKWINKIVSARLSGNDADLKTAIDHFMTRQVLLAVQQSHNVHDDI
jgi:hypothetical protein